MQCHDDSAEYTDGWFTKCIHGDADCQLPSRGWLYGDDHRADGLSDKLVKLGCQFNIELYGNDGCVDTKLGTTGADSGKWGDDVGNSLCGDVQLEEPSYGTIITDGECIGNTCK